ncbi:hypothetical protein OQJ66_20740, partial [Aquimarina muelleri]|uniref:hypothetical protein n=1 Tax=Aquimarina muelleri TaxID=279356 RepID=UPI00224931E7
SVSVYGFLPVPIWIVSIWGAVFSNCRYFEEQVIFGLLGVELLCSFTIATVFNFFVYFNI